MAHTRRLQESDVRRFTPSDRLLGATVASVMRPAPCAFADTSLAALRMAFDDHRVSAVIVVDRDRVPRGIVTARDLATDEAADAIAEWMEGGDEPGRHIELAERRADDVMMPLVFTVPEGTPLLVAARLMVFEGITHLPIVDRRRAVTGIVSALDLVRHVMSHVEPM